MIGVIVEGHWSHDVGGGNIPYVDDEVDSEPVLVLVGFPVIGGLVVVALAVGIVTGGYGPWLYL